MTPVESHTRRVTKPGELTKDEYGSAAQACRLAAYQAESDAAKQSNPSVAKIFNDSARRFRALAAKLEVNRSGAI